ncbi:MAG: Ig-like domain-containing protein [Clostridiales bacterium]|nr:Ig-like domain-containing protein [Clostridiales bacterium]
MKHPLPRILRKLLSLVLTAALLVGTATPLAEAYTHASEYRSGYSIYDGIDVSKWQGTINWSKVAAAGIDFVFIRCGYTSTSSFTMYTDPQFVTNIKNAQKYGIKVGVYYFSQAKSTSEAKKEAAYVLKLLDGYDLDLPVAFDAENAGGRFKFSSFTKTQCTNFALAFCAAIEAGGYDACVYNSVSTFSGSGAKYNPTTILNKGYQLWVARYNKTASDSSYSVSGYTYWQYSSTGSVSGISGNVDLDFWYSPLELCVEVDDDTAITALSLNKTKATLSPGGTLSLTATVTPSDTADPVCWSSSDSSVAYVDDSGTVTAVQSGTATITASSSSGDVTATCKVTVSGTDPDEVIVVTYGDDAFDLDDKTALSPSGYQAMSDGVLTVTEDGATAINGAGVTDVTAAITTVSASAAEEDEQADSSAATEAEDEESEEPTESEETTEPATSTDPADEADGNSSAGETAEAAAASEAEEAMTAAEAEADAEEADETAEAEAAVTAAAETEEAEAETQAEKAADASDEGETGVTALSTTTKTIRVVVQRLSLSSATLKLKSTSLTYTGSAVTPTVSSLKVGNLSVPSSGYTLYANNNINRGKATATAVGVGNYSGAVSTTFYIRSSQTISVSKTSYNLALGSSAFYLQATNASQYGGKLTYSSSKTSVATVSSSGKVTIKGLGLTYITITAAQNDRYAKTTTKIKVKVVPKKVTLSSVSAGKKKFTVKWKTTTCSGYQIQYSTSSSFKTYKTVTVSGKSSSSKTISGLKSKTKYYVRVRAYYKTTATSYGAWSSKKSVKTK